MDIGVRMDNGFGERMYDEGRVDIIERMDIEERKDFEERTDIEERMDIGE